MTEPLSAAVVHCGSAVSGLDTALHRPATSDYGLAGAAPLPMRREYFQDLSLTGQPRDRSRALPEILSDFSGRIAR